MFDLSEALSAPGRHFPLKQRGSDDCPLSTRLTIGKSDERAKELVAIYNYEVPVPEDPFSFSDLRSINALNYLQVPLHRLERFQLHPTFNDADPLINDALIYIRDELLMSGNYEVTT